MSMFQLRQVARGVAILYMPLRIYSRHSQTDIQSATACGMPADTMQQIPTMRPRNYVANITVRVSAHAHKKYEPSH